MLLFEKINFNDEEAACPYCAGDSYPPDGKLMFELDFFNGDCKKIKVDETFTLDQKQTVLNYLNRWLCQCYNNPQEGILVLGINPSYPQKNSRTAKIEWSNVWLFFLNSK